MNQDTAIGVIYKIVKPIRHGKFKCPHKCHLFEQIWLALLRYYDKSGQQPHD